MHTVYKLIKATLFCSISINRQCTQLQILINIWTNNKIFTPVSRKDLLIARKQLPFYFYSTVWMYYVISEVIWSFTSQLSMMGSICNLWDLWGKKISTKQMINHCEKGKANISVSLAEQELLSLSEHQSSPPFLVGFVLLDL